MTDDGGVAANLDGVFQNMSVGEGDSRRWCPVQGCVCAAGSGHPGWKSDVSLKAHIDGHLVGSIGGEVPGDWMRGKGWVACSVCGLSASVRRRGGVHERCAAEARARVQASSSFRGDVPNDIDDGGWGELLRRLPTMQEIMTTGMSTKEFTSRGLRRLYRQEFGRLCGRVVRYNVVGAWEHLVGGGGDGRADTLEMKV